MKQGYIKIGDEIHFAAYFSRVKGDSTIGVLLQDADNSYMIKNGIALKGRIVAFLPDAKEIDVMTYRGHHFNISVNQFGVDLSRFGMSI